MLGKLFKRIPYFEALRAFLEQWGLWAYIKAAGALMTALMFAAWGWVESNLPYWAITLVFLSVWALFLFTVNYSVEVYRKASAEKLDYALIGDELIQLSDDMLRSIDDYIREQMAQNFRRQTHSIDTPEQMYQDWEERRERDDLMVRHISRNYGRRVMAATMVLKKLDVSLPFHISHMDASTVRNMASFFGAVGQLIKSGNLSVAQTMDDQTRWNVSGMLR